MNAANPEHPQPVSEQNDIPVLEGWVGLTEAAERLGVTRQHGYRMAQNKKFSSLHRIGESPITVVSTEELESMIAARSGADTPEE